VEAQTLANVYLALDNELEIIVVLNKVDLPGAPLSGEGAFAHAQDRSIKNHCASTLQRDLVYTAWSTQWFFQGQYQAER